MKNKRLSALAAQILIVALSLLLAACQANASPATAATAQTPGGLPPPKETRLNSSTAVATPNPAAAGIDPAKISGDSPDPAAEVSPPVAYTIEASFDFSSRFIQINQTIRYRVLSAEQETLWLINEPERRGEDFNLRRVLLSGEAIHTYTAEPGSIQIPLPVGSQAGDQIEASLEYAYRLPARASRLGYTQFQVNFGDWYLIVPPYSLDTGWLQHPPSAVGEYVNYELASFDIHITLTAAPPDLVIAASLQPDQEENVYRFTSPKMRSFAWSASPYYQVSSQEAAGTALFAYYFSNHRAAGEAALQAAAKAIELYSRTIAPIELPSLSIVESLFLDGMEYQGLFFLGMEYFQEYDSTPQNYLIPIAVHETAHQWFYAVVANDQALEPWVDEVLCVYLELIYYEETYPELVDWWWQFRVFRFNPQGWVNSTVYDHTQFRTYVDAVYLRGALWLDGIRDQVGDENFFAALQRNFSDHQYRLVRGDQFLEAFEDSGYSPDDARLSEFFDQ